MPNRTIPTTPKRKLYIRPLYSPADVLKGFAVTTCAGEPLVDSEILEHFDRSATGVEIREAMLSCHPNVEIQWSGALCTG
jgi:hypothetical protein